VTISAGLDRWTNSAQTTLSGNGGSITAGATSMKVANALPFPQVATGFFRVLVDNEIIQITAGQGTTTWTISRGMEGTSAASHNDGATVTHDVSAWELNSFRQEFNVIAYAAVGDGVADDTTPFQNAINDAHAQTVGGVVFIPTAKFKIVGNLTTYSNVVFVSYGATLSGAGAGTVTPLINWGLTGTLTLPAALTVSAGGASITGGLTVVTGGLTVSTGGIVVVGTTTFHGVAYTWPSTSGTSGFFLQTDGAGNVSWQSAAGGVSSVSGTTNQVTASPSTGNVVVGLPSGGTLPGSWHGATGFTVDAGGLTVTAGGANITGGITGTLNTAAQPNITSVGVLTSLTVSAGGTSSTGNNTLTGQQSSGQIALTINPANVGSVTAETIGIQHSAQTLTITGSYTNQRFTWLRQDTITAGSALTVTTAATLAIEGAPVAAGSAAITNAYALWVQAGTTQLQALNAGTTSLGTTTTGTTNTGSLTIGGTFSKGGNALTGSFNSSDVYPFLPSATGAQLWIQSSDPGGSANNGDLWFAG
jgi:Pectate lyase superfamily protein